MTLPLDTGQYLPFLTVRVIDVLGRALEVTGRSPDYKELLVLVT